MAESELAALAHELSSLSALEMADALGGGKIPRPLRRLLTAPFLAASKPLGRVLAEFDLETARLGLPQSAARTLARLRVRLRVSGTCPERGPLLVVGNHPGAYDALALMSATGRADLMIIAAERSFLRALPRVSRHIAFLGERPDERARGLRRALAHLAAGGALLHFPAGCIEPDPDFFEGYGSPLQAWQGSVAPFVRAVARAEGQVLVAGVRGVHSLRIKRSPLIRLADKRGLTTLAPLLQILCRARDVNAHVAFGVARAASELLGSASPQAELRSALEKALSKAPEHCLEPRTLIAAALA